MRRRIYVLILLVCLLFGCKSLENADVFVVKSNSNTSDLKFSFKELDEIFRQPFVSTNRVVYRKEYYENIQFSSYAGFGLLKEYITTENIVNLFYGMESGVNGDIGIRLIVENNGIKSIIKYRIKGMDFMNMIDDYNYFNGKYDIYYYYDDLYNGIFAIWDAGTSFIMLAYSDVKDIHYIEFDAYYVALVDKSVVVKDENSLYGKIYTLPEQTKPLWADPIDFKLNF